MKCQLQLVIFVLTVAFIAAVSSSDLSSNVTKERIIDDEKAINREGVPIDYSYNETVVGSADDLTSAPGCPKSINGTPWVYHGTPPRCFFAGGVGPCKDGSVFISQRGSFYGICPCLCLVDPDFDPNNKVETERYIQCNTTTIRKYPVDQGQIYDKKTQQCYGLFKRGLCNGTSLLVGLNNDSPACLPQCRTLKLDIGALEAEARGICASYRQGSVVPSIGKGECEKGKKWSSLVQKCVAKYLDQDSGVLG